MTEPSRPHGAAGPSARVSTNDWPAQPGILAPVPRAAGYLFLSRRAGIKPAAAYRSIQALASHIDGEKVVLGLSAMFLTALGRSVQGLRPFPVIQGARVDLPVLQSDLFLWIRANDGGEVFHQMRALEAQVTGQYLVDQRWMAFRHQAGNDLTGFEDGTENPKGMAARKAALVAEGSWRGSSFVAVQPWVHEFNQFDALTPARKNAVIGRDLLSNEELADAPASAHIKRTAQEEFEPQAFLLRRSMPWVEGRRAGLMFVAFGRSFDAFEAQLTRMSGAEDGIVDALFTVSRPAGGGYYWCPPMAETGALRLP